MSFSIK